MPVARALLHAGRMRIVALLALVSGCALYWNDPTPPPEPPICTQAGGGGAGLQYRNPQTGECMYIDNDPCGTGSATGTFVDWPACMGPCDQLKEADCLAESGCHAAYVDFGTTSSFVACWNPPALGIRNDGACSGLDAYTCADHDNCSSLFAKGQFYKCLAEPGGVCTTNADCPAHQHCNQCDTCDQLVATCVPDEACTTLTTEAACNARSDCSATYTGYDCTCIGMVCTCKTEVFASCQPR